MHISAENIFREYDVMLLSKERINPSENALNISLHGPYVMQIEAVMRHNISNWDCNVPACYTVWQQQAHQIGHSGTVFQEASQATLSSIIVPDKRNISGP